ncbi:PKD domain-containing protein [Carboxylicivirga mesophila]|uniref:PKD domain-containing protein n=1 Tax=Carboxylicivirga mesophila TaxID=1166478 RepID=A0ABS5KD94_9BACT|nr:PKD domain-containing protein [Carboxylicivirga mesophila]MBS2212313.1 PKD domain-containing protein [Carboxylicivirga mesophila]
MKSNLLSCLFALMALALVFTSCEDDETKPIVKAQFEASSYAVSVDETVKFTNYSTGSTAYEWYFGDGELSTEESPEHTYQNGGKYTVKLIVDNSGVKDSTEKVVTVSEFGYVINYGGYSGEKTTISLYDKITDELTNGYFTYVNGTHMVSNVQYAYNYNDKVYFMSNNLDQVNFVDAKSFKQTSNGITEGIIKPRYCVADGDVLYVSCWGGDIWTDTNLSYIAKIDLTTNTVTGKIDLPGGPEGLAIANGKLYAALNYENRIAVIDLSNEAISYITTPAVSSYFLKDSDDNLYVSLVSTYSNFSDKDGLGYINTITDEITTYELSGVSSSYVNILAADKTFSKLYVMTSAYDANWNLSGAIAVFDVASKTFETNNIVDGLSGLNGIAVNSITDNVYGFISPGATQAGRINVYTSEGSLVKELSCGISPIMMFDIN